jgi:hypothetical protein
MSFTKSCAIQNSNTIHFFMLYDCFFLWLTDANSWRGVA